MSEPMNSETRLHALRQVSGYLDAMLEAPSAFRGSQLRGSGPVADFEVSLAERCGFPHCLATASATAGLLAVAAAARLPGRKVLVPEEFWPGTSGALRFAGVDLVAVPVNSEATLDLAAIERHLAAGDIAAIITGDGENRHGSAAELHNLCQTASCLHIEDSSWLPGVSAPNGPPSQADVQVMSFGPGKPLALGEGGAVLTRSQSLYARLVACSQHPERCAIEGFKCDLEHLALNARIHPLAAVLGVALLSEL